MPNNVRACDVDPVTWAKLQAAAGLTPAVPAGALVKAVPKKRRPPDVRVRSSGRWSIALELACRVISDANRRDHWTVKRRRAEIQREALARALAGAGLSAHRSPLPVSVTWTRSGPQLLDDDNLRPAFKALRDALAGWLGVDDADPRVSWHYRDQLGEPGVTVAIEGRP